MIMDDESVRGWVLECRLLVADDILDIPIVRTVELGVDETTTEEKE